jgi:Protein of unknown function (DUF4242)
MVYVVERYLPGLNQGALETSLERLREVTQGTPVTYLGSMIVPTDEACFCQFDGPSEEAIAEANRRAGVPFDRIVAAVAVPA